MEKLIKDNKVAVLVSGGFGAGWSTWASEYETEVLFDKDIVQAVLDNSTPLAIKELAETKYPDLYTGGVCGLEVVWVEVGTRFKIHEYDGAESIEYYSQDSYNLA
jgi:hypothetical protein